MSKNSYAKRFGKRIAALDGGWFCHYCGEALIPSDVKDSDSHYFVRVKSVCMGEYVWSAQPINGLSRATIDHVIPRCMGGSDELKNLVLACWECNTAKHVKSAQQFKEERLQYGD